MTSATKRKLGEILVAAGAISEGELSMALANQPADAPLRVGEILVRQGRITAKQLARALSVQHTVPYMDLPDIPPPVLDLVPVPFQRKHRLVPFRLDGERVSVAMAEPGDKDAVKALRELLGPTRRVVVFVTAGDEIDAVHTSLGEDVELTVDDVEPLAPDSAKLEELFGDLDLNDTSGAPAPSPLAPPPADEPADAREVLDAADLFSGDEADAVQPPAPPAPSPFAPPPFAPDPVGPPAPAASALLPFDDAVSPSEDAQQRAAEALDAFLGSSDTLLTRGEWTGRLEQLPDRMLLLALTRLLVERGIIREQDLLDLLGKP